MREQKVDLMGIAEAKTLHLNVNDVIAPLKWTAGYEASRKSGGIGILYHKNHTKLITKLETSESCCWYRLNTNKRALIIGFAYIPTREKKKERSDALEHLRKQIEKYRNGGDLVVLGDFNGRTGMNGDRITNTEGRSILKLAARLDLTIMNGTHLARGQFTRVVKKSNRSIPETSTIDYCLASEGAFGRISDVQLCPNDTSEFSTGSDHCIITVTIHARPESMSKLEKRMRYDWNTPATKNAQDLIEERLKPITDSSAMVEVIARTIEEQIPLKEIKPRRPNSKDALYASPSYNKMASRRKQLLRQMKEKDSEPGEKGIGIGGVEAQQRDEGAGAEHYSQAT
jgi:hypothetical protein